MLVDALGAQVIFAAVLWVGGEVALLVGVGRVAAEGRGFDGRGLLDQR